MARHLAEVFGAVCSWLPEAEEFSSHGMPTFRVRGKSFASFVVNHHGDGRVALWLSAPSGAQSALVEADPRRFFVPPYVGTRGWLGIELHKGLSWKRVAALVREAYENVAPAALCAAIGDTPDIKKPVVWPTRGDIDPLQSRRGKVFVKAMRGICLGFPETREILQFGSPVWQAGKKTFAWARAQEGELLGCFWVGAVNQSLLIDDPRFTIPAYMGHNGWIAVNVTRGMHAAEMRTLAVESYRHFALRRMLVQMGEA